MATYSWNNFIPPESQMLNGVWFPGDEMGHNWILVQDIRALVRRMVEPELAEQLIVELDLLYERNRFPLP